MKNLLKHVSVMALLFLISFKISGQNDSTRINAFFNKSDTTIFATPNNLVEFDFSIQIAKQSNNHKTKVYYGLIENEFQIDKVDCSLPIDNFIESDTSNNVNSKGKVIFKYTGDKDRLIRVKLLFGVSGNDTLNFISKDTVLNIYVRKAPKDTLTHKTSHEMWFYSGTNFDLLEGIKAEELYFKGSYLFGLGKSDSLNEQKKLAYITFGKNRYFSERDSITGISFTEQAPAIQDSIGRIRGTYNTLRRIKVDNIYFTLNGLCKLGDNLNQKSRLYGSYGIGANLQKVNYSYSNYDINQLDTLYVEYAQGDTVRYNPMAQNISFSKFSYNLNLGLMHILRTDKVNVKTQLLIGANINNEPFLIRQIGTNRVEYYERKLQVWSKFEILATALKPGVSLGFETIINGGAPPIFNVSLTKVLDLEAIGSLFGSPKQIEY